MVDAPRNDTTASAKPAAGLTARGYQARLTAPDGRPPWLTITTPAATTPAETIMADAQSLWWPWADQIAPTAGAATAADAIAQVRAPAPAGGGE